MNHLKLRQLRIDRKLSLLDLADCLGLKTAGGYKRIETGENKLKAEHLPILAEKFQINVNELTEVLFFESGLDESSNTG